MLKSQSPLAENIKNLYSSIKNNDVETFKTLILKDKNLLNIQNNKQNNLLFYTLDKKNIEIFDLISKKKPGFLLEKNTDGFNCFTSLVNKSALKNTEFFLENTSEKNKENLASSFDNNNNNLVMQMLKKGNSFYKCYINHFEKYDNYYTYSHISNEGQTIPHLMALHDTVFALNILDMPQFKRLGQKNNKGVTPFLLASRHSSFELFKKIAEKSDIHEKTDLLSNAIHFASYQGNIDKLYYLLEKGVNPNEKNLYQNTALSTSLVEKKFEFASELLKVVNEIEFEDVLYMVRASEKNPNMFSYLLKNQTLLLNTLKDNNKISKFLTHVFYYASESIITENKEFFKEMINKEPNLLNSLFLSSIAGRRDFLSKVNYIIENYGWTSLENNSFTNFNKEYPSGFVHALNQLPRNQLEYLVNHSPIIENLKDKELIIFKMICINKNSTIFNKVSAPYDFSLIKDDTSVLALIDKISTDKIINNLIFFEEMFVNKNITDFVTDKIAQHIFENDTPVKQFKDVFAQIKNVKLKREIYIKLNEILLSDTRQSDLELIFKNKYTIMENVLNDMLIESPEKFQNFKYLINNPAITLKPVSAWSYLRANNFDKKIFFVVQKTPELFNYIKDINFSEEKYISSDFLKLVMQVSHKNEKVNLFISFLDYSSKHDNISPHTYNYFFTQFTEKEQKHIVKTAFHNYLKSNGTDLACYQFLEKKYLNFYSIESLNKNIINLGNKKHLDYRLSSDSSYINVFNSYINKEFNSIDIINVHEFKNSINIFTQKMNDFNDIGLKDFLNSKIKDPNLMGLSEILSSNISKDLNTYTLVINKLESFLKDSSTIVKFFQNSVDSLLFNKNSDIQQMVLKSEKITTSSFLTPEQKSYIFTQVLEDKLHHKKETKKVVKI